MCYKTYLYTSIWVINKAYVLRNIRGLYKACISNNYEIYQCIHVNTRIYSYISFVAMFHNQ